MAIIKRLSSKATVGKVEKYLKQEEKTEEKLISGMNCDGDNFARECRATNLLYDKNQGNDDRKYYHVIQSFSPKDAGALSHEKAHELAMKFAEKNFKGHEVLVVTHKDKEHIHNHFIVNSVSIDTGIKYRADNKSLWRMREHSNELCKENGLIHSIQDLKKKSKDKITSGELRKAARGDDVWKLDLRAQIKIAAQRSVTVEDFKIQMKAQFKVEVQERNKISRGSKKVIFEYKPQGNRKFCPEYRLGADYGKENIDGVIGRNQEKAGRENSGIERTDSGIRSTGSDSRNIETGIRNRQAELVEFEIRQREQELARQGKASERNGNRSGEAKDIGKGKSKYDRER